MRPFDRKLISAFAVVAGLPVVGACSTDSFSNINVIPKPDLRPDWLTYSGNREEFTLRPAGPADLVGPEGQCAAAGAPADGDASPPEAPASAPGGIALQMTECDVVRRAGAPERVELGTNERGDRTAVLTYTRGTRPGIYRFANGRLVSVERGPEPEAPPRSQKATKKRG